MAAHLTSASDLLAKLDRTFYRRPTYSEEQLDWVFDMAVTAWHILDWVAVAEKRHHTELARELRRACPELAVCEQICHGARHLRLRRKDIGAFAFDRDVSQTDSRWGVSRPGRAGDPDANFDIMMTPAVQVTDVNDQTWDAGQVFIEVIRSWRKRLGAEAVR